jgi:hypothetical protein
VIKSHILAEIKRTATANGGVALGRRRFETETGIRESDWAGKYWARWSDALAEAGLTPNKLVGAFDEDELLRPLAAFARELGRLPVTHEMRMRKKTDPTLPNEKVFARRFGSRAEAVRRLGEYCRRTAGFEDVATMCATAAIAEPPSSPEHDEDDSDEFGFVYLIKSGRYYKIGRSNAVGRREREIALQLPEKADTVHVIRTDDPAGIEVYWHQRFAAQRKNGEWFDLRAADVKAFRRRKFM